MRARVAVLILMTLTCLTADAQERFVRSEQGRALLGQIQELDQELQQQVHHSLLAAGHVLPAALGERARQHRQNLVHLQRLAATLPATEQELLLTKIGQLSWLIGNLERVAAVEDPAALAKAVVRRSAAQHPVTPLGQVSAANETCVTAMAVGDGAWTGSTLGAGNDGHAPCGASYSSPDVWFSYTAASSGWIGVNTFGSDFDTVVSVHESCPGTVGNSIVCDDDSYGLQSAVELLAEQGVTYLVRVSGFDGAAGSFVLTLGQGAAISGTVRRADNQRPLAGIWVGAFDQAGFYLGSTVTGQDGTYRADGLLQQTLYVGTREARPYLDLLYDGLFCPGGAGLGCDPTTGTPVLVSPGTETGGIDLALPTGGSIAGTVREAGTTTVVAGAELTVFDEHGKAVSSCLSNVAGTYLAGGLPTGTFFVMAAHPEHATQLHADLPCPGGVPGGCDPTTGAAVAVTLGSTTAGIDFHLARIGSIAGRLTDATSGEPLDNASVEVRDSNGILLTTAATTSTGTYFAGGLETGSYLVKARSPWHEDQLYNGVPCEQTCGTAAATLVAVVDGATTSGIDFALARLGEITGQVVTGDTGEAVTLLSVIVTDSNGTEVAVGNVQWDGSYRAAVQQSGYYTARTADLNPWSLPFLHTYIDEMYDDISCDEGCPPDQGTPIPVTRGATTSGIDFILEHRGSISGTVSDATTGGPLADVSVEIRSLTGSLEQRLRTDAAGQYHSQILYADSYLVVTRFSERHTDQLYNGVPCPGGPWVGCSPESGTPVQVVNENDLTGIDLALQPAAITGISGTVRNAITGAPQPGVRIVIHDQTGTALRTLKSDAAGLYTSYGMAPGTYFVLADSSELSDQLYNSLPCTGCDPTTGTPVVVAPGTVTRHVDFSLEPGGAIAGRVVDEVTGDPVLGRVYVWNQAGDDIRTVQSSPDGSYLVEGLPVGSFRLSFASAAGEPYLAELYNDVPCPLGPVSCELGLATPVAVSSGQTVTGIDAGLDYLGSGILVRVTGRDGQAIPGVYVDVWSSDTGVLAATAVTGAAGSCLVVVPEGSYHVSTHNTLGYPDQVFQGQRCADGSVFSGACALSGGTLVVVLAAQITDGVDFMLAPLLFSNGFESGYPSAWSTVVGAAAVDEVAQGLGSINGRVTSRSTGEPIQGLPVTAYNSTGAEAGRFYTGADGSYGIMLPPGTYTAVAGGGPCPAEGCSWVGRVYDDIVCDPYCLWMDGTPIEVLQDTTTEGIDFALDRRGVITGTVTEAATGAPIPGVTVQAWRLTSLLPVARETTDSNGAYGISGLDPGSYYLIALAQGDVLLDEVYNDLPCRGGVYGTCTLANGTPVPVVLNTVTTQIDLALDRGGVLAGTISDSLSGQPISGAGVGIYNADGDRVANATSNATGSWQVPGLASGTYFALAVHLSHQGNLFNGLPCPGGSRSCDVTAGTPIQVTLATTTPGIDFALQPFGAIAGVVRDASTGLPVLRAEVEFYAQDGSLALSGLATRTTASGYYSRSLEPGTYFALAYSDHHELQLFDGLPGCPGCDVTVGTPIVVEPGVTTRSVDFDLPPLQAGAIAGMVSDDQTGNPLNGKSIWVWNENGTLVASALTGEQGSYRVSGLEPGTYYLATTGAADVYLNELYDDLPMEHPDDPTKGTPVTVTDGTTTHADLALSFIGSGIVVTVQHSLTHAPLAGVLVDIWHAFTGALVTTTVTGTTGMALVSLPAGTYHLSTDSNLGLTDQVYSGMPCPAGSAFTGACDPSTGTPITVTQHQLTEGVTILLGPAILFQDSFETGDATRWSARAP